MNLQPAATSLLEQRPDVSHSELQAEERRLERFGNVAFGGFSVVVGLAICGFIYLIVIKMILSGAQPIAGILMALFLAFAGLSLGYVFWRESLKEKRKKLEARPAAGLRAPSATSKLLDEPSMEPVPSIIDDTTELLTVKNRTNQL